MKDDKDIARGAFVSYLNKLSKVKHNKELGCNKMNDKLNKNI